MLDLSNLPPQIVPAVEAFAQRLATHVQQQREGSLATHEEGVLAAFRAEAGALLSGVVAAATTGADPHARPARSACPHCVQTRLGPLTLTRTRYRCPQCRRTWSRADQTLGLAPRQRTRAALAQWEAHLAALVPFREAAQLLAELAGVTVGSETLRTHAERLGTERDRQQSQATAEVLATQAPPTSLPYAPAPGHLVVEADGVLVRYRARGLDGSPWHEVKLGLVGGWTGTRPTAHLQQPSYVAVRDKAAPFARRLAAEAARRGALDVVGWLGHATDGGGHIPVLRSVVVLGDGAKWIWDEVASSFGSERTEIVDWWHASEHLWDLSKALHGTGSPTARAWADQAQHRLWHPGPEPLLTLLRQTVPTSPEATTALQRERGYFRGNASRMQYPVYRRAGLPVGSGAVEGGAKHLVQQRLKRAGMRWSERGARAVLQLRCAALSHATFDSLAA